MEETVVHAELGLRVQSDTPPVVTTDAAPQQSATKPAQPSYLTCATRDSWSELPSSVRLCIVEMLGGHPHDEPTTLSAGFSRGFAAAMRVHNQRDAFVRAVPEHYSRNYKRLAREARVLRWLPAQSPAPRLLRDHTVFCDGRRWHITITEHIQGAKAGAAIDQAGLDLWQRALADMGALIGIAPSTVTSQRIWDLTAPALGEAQWFDRLHAGMVQPPEYLPACVVDQGREVAALCRVAAHDLPAEKTCHGGIRPDRMLVDKYGRARLTGWASTLIGPRWTDWVLLLMWSHRAGLDVTSAMSDSAMSADAPAEHIDALLAAYATRHIQAEQHLDTGYSSTRLQYHRDAAQAALGWLADRRAWQ